MALLSLTRKAMMTPTLFDMSLCLYSRGFYIGPRDPNRNTAFEGEWMVCGDPVTPRSTEDASNGGYCIVGDDLDALIREAYNAEYDETA